MLGSKLPNSRRGQDAWVVVVGRALSYTGTYYILQCEARLPAKAAVPRLQQEKGEEDLDFHLSRSTEARSLQIHREVPVVFGAELGEVAQEFRIFTLGDLAANGVSYHKMRQLPGRAKQQIPTGACGATANRKQAPGRYSRAGARARASSQRPATGSQSRRDLAHERTKQPRAAPNHRG